MKTVVEQRKALLEKELGRIVHQLVEHYDPEKIILFGSLARGNVHAWSDVDLAIIKETDKKFLDRIGEVLFLVQPIVGLNVVVYTPEEVNRMIGEDHYFFVDEILGKGKVLYDKSP